MDCDSKCEHIQFKVTSAHLVHIHPRPKAGAPPDLELIFSEAIKAALETDRHTGPEGCDCVTGDPVEVGSREQITKVTHGDYTAWFRVQLVKYRTAGECMPANDDLPEGVRG